MAPAFKKSGHERPNFSGGVVGGEAAGDVYTFDLLDIEAYAVNFVFYIEIKEFFRMIEGRLGQYRDHVEIYLLVLEEMDSTHHPLVGSFSSPGLATGIMKKGRTVNADADAHVVMLEEVAPSRG